ncbi:hypothetical protein OUZ56_010457 [Daphnia magna]|uniref:Uncharacterized protein n=1 Tax=Daphnia magna TaxID=35525 RepID=A0ABR0AIK9_9CRUS|nr:hypothetical protein OUZ56_010457 [Daphnia magna]
MSLHRVSSLSWAPLEEFPGFPRGLQALLQILPRLKRTNPRLPSCPRDPSRRLYPLRELSSVPVETSSTPASSLESGTSFVGEALNFEGPIPKDHLTEEADSQGESVETARDSDSDSETNVILRAASPVVPVGRQKFLVPSRHIKQPQRQAMEAVRKFISSLIF